MREERGGSGIRHVIPRAIAPVPIRARETPTILNSQSPCLSVVGRRETEEARSAGHHLRVPAKDSHIFAIFERLARLTSYKRDVIR